MFSNNKNVYCTKIIEQIVQITNKFVKVLTSIEFYKCLEVYDELCYVQRPIITNSKRTD